MAIADLNARDYMRLYTAFKKAREIDALRVPSLEELIPAIRKAVGQDGEIVDNLVPVFGDTIRPVFDTVRGLIVEKHGETYADELWDRFLRKGSD